MDMVKVEIFGWFDLKWDWWPGFGVSKVTTMFIKTAAQETPW